MNFNKKVNSSKHLLNFEISFDKKGNHQSQSSFKLPKENRANIRYPIDLKIYLIADEKSEIVTTLNTVNISNKGIFVKQNIPENLINKDLVFVISYQQENGQKIKFKVSGHAMHDSHRIIFKKESEPIVERFINQIFETENTSIIQKSTG